MTANTQIDLCGEWKLTYFEEGTFPCDSPNKLSEIPEVQKISAAVPGNIVSDLYKSGVIDDPYIHMNAQQLREYESYEWWYEKEFDVTEDFYDKSELVFECIDCYGTVWLNDEKLGRCANAFIPQVFSVDGKLRIGRNRLCIRIASAKNILGSIPLDANCVSHMRYSYETLQMRSPAHAWGWDIAPRMPLGGIWKEVYLKKVKDVEFTEWYVQTSPDTTSQKAKLLFHYNIKTSDVAIFDYAIRLSGKCGDSNFVFEQPIWATRGVFRFDVDDPKLWWPRGYGEANLYDITLELLHKGQVITSTQKTLGIRTVKLVNKPLATDLSEPDFQFIINNVPVVVKGTNWVPADALHSNDINRIPKILDMAIDLNCNMLRVWGGGTYEPHMFYDICDSNGIMVWQDFMMGCVKYPQDEDFQKVLSNEAEIIIKKLRQHPSIVVWAGDNECDQAHNWSGYKTDPNDNILTRKVLPEILRRHDPLRPFLPSSPWISPEAYEKSLAMSLPSPDELASEQHLWGPRDYFKNDFYGNTKASFVSEIGYHGCPSVSSIKKFIAPEHLWPLENNPQWDYHASNPYYGDNDDLNYRTNLMAKQVKEVFGNVPNTLEDFVFASQICQAEAKKYFIELVRGRKEKMSGIIWWNLIDCWPQFSDAIVDYYFSRKLAYYYIKRIQHPVLVMLDEQKNWHYDVSIINDNRQAVTGEFHISDADKGKVLLKDSFTVSSNTKYIAGKINLAAGDQKLLLLEWKLSDGTFGVNHALCGCPKFELDQYRTWLEKIAALDNSFNTQGGWN